jgi:hypothetical protein
MIREEKAWKRSTRKKVYFSCFDCDFAISEERKQQVLSDLKFHYRSD